MHQYMGITTRGLEEISNSEIVSKHPGAAIKEIGYRKIIFETNANINELNNLRSLEDIFLLIRIIENVGHLKSDGSKLVSAIINTDYRSSLKYIRNIRDIKNFSISYSSVGKRNFSSVFIKNTLKVLLPQKFGLIFEDELHEDFDLRIFVEHNQAYLGVRINSKPLHRRNYKLESSPGSLKSSIAYSLCALANINSSDIVLDPLCGSGTIPIECHLFSPSQIIAGDLSPTAISIAKNNLSRNNLNSNLAIWDAQKLPLKDNSIDKIITNLPFGKQIYIEDMQILYDNLFLEFTRVIKNTGTMVLLTNQNQILENSINKLGVHAFIINKVIDISLHGEQCYIYIIKQEKH